MEQNIKIAVIGGIGKSGKYLVKQLLEQGFHFNILVRNPEKFKVQSPQAEIIHGNVNDPAAVHALLEGCSAVISTLGLGIPASEKNIFTTGTGNILEAMKAHGIRRYLVTTGLNVDAPADRKSPQTVFATDWMKQNYPVTTADKQEEYAMLAASDADWTLVRLPMIKETDESGEIAVSLEDCPGDQISATSLARFLISQLADHEYVKRSPFIANK